MKNKITIPIFFACDDNYMPFLAVALRSLIDNADGRYFYKIHILNAGLSQKSCTRVAKMATKNISVEFVDVSENMKRLGEKLNLRDYYTSSIYFRIFIPHLFSQYKKAIYLDSDIVIPGDISKLYFTELSDNLIGAVSDDVISSREVFIDYAEQGCGIEHKKYFNSGVLLMNLSLMRELDIEGKCAELMNRYHFDTVCPDQDYLNVLCYGHVLHLDRGWNKMSIDTDYNGVPNLIHYNMFNKPWQYDGVAYGDFFWYYAERTDFYDDICAIREGFGEQEIAAQQTGLEMLISNASRIAGSDFNFRTVLFS